ncbi:MAG: PAS domain-containing sensor histidine kinase [Clostridia bacterium]|nr:PAS domain-containing sensor histidine kinase [Clostridia bacterium]
MNKGMQLPYLITECGKIKKVDKGFTKLTGYREKAFLEKDLSEVFKNVLKVRRKIPEDLRNKGNCFLFTNLNEVKEVEIVEKKMSSANQKKYTFITRSNLLLDDKFPFLEELYRANHIGIAVFSVPDFVLLKANQYYIDAIGRNPTGMAVEEILDGWHSSESCKIWMNAVQSGEAYHNKEHLLELDLFKDTYWNYTLTPICEEGKVRYLFLQLSNETEKDTFRNELQEQTKAIKEQNRQLEAVIENMSDALFIFDKDGNLLVNNKKARKYFPKGTMNTANDLYVSCKFYNREGEAISKEDIPVFQVLNGKKISDAGVTIEYKGKKRHLSVSGTPIYSDSGNIIMAVICSKDVTRYIDQAKLLEQRSRQMEAIIENMSDGLFIMDKNYKTTMLNREAREFFYRSEIFKNEGDSLTHNRYLNIEGKEMALLETSAYKVLKGEKIRSIRITAERPDKTVHFDISGSPVYDEEGKVAYAIICSRDVTGRVETEKLVLDQKKQLETVIENISDAILVCDKDGNYIMANRAAREFFPSGSIGRAGFSYSMAKYFDTEGNEVLHDQMPLTEAIKSRKIANKRMIVKQPDSLRHVNISAVPILDNTGNINTVTVCVRDITELVKYGELIKKQRDYLYKIIDTFDLPIIRITYPDYKLIELNQKAYGELCGLSGSKQEFLHRLRPGDKVVDLFPDFFEGESFECIRKMAESQNTIYRNCFQVKKNHRNYYMKTIYQPIINSQDQIEEFLIISFDVTWEVEQREALQKLIEMKDEFLSLISHEFRTPLTVINSAIQAIENICKDELTPRVNGFIKRIKQNSLRQLRLVNNLLDITRVKSGRINIRKTNMDIVFITKSIVESVSLYASQKEIKINFESEHLNKIIAIDEEKYERILLNLLSNAIKFTPRGKEIKVRVFQKKHRVYIEVEDEGVGIPRDKQSLIFEKFGQVDSSLTRQAEGTGIGLSLVKMFVIAMGGSIRLKSKEKKGSTFTLLFPDQRVEDKSEDMLKEITDNRLIQVAAVEFSDIYI